MPLNVTHDAHVTRGGGRFKQQLLLHVVSVLVFIHQYVAHGAADPAQELGVEQQVVDDALLVGEVDAIVAEQRVAVVGVSAPQLLQEGVGVSRQSLGINQFLRDLVEVVAQSLNCAPFGLPSAQVGRRGVLAANPIEMVEEKEQLAEVIQRFVTAAERRAMPVLSDDAVADAVDCSHPQAGKVFPAVYLAGRGGDAVTEFVCRLFGEGAKDKLCRLAAAQKEQVHSTQHETERLARTGTGNHEHWAIQMGHYFCCASFKAGNSLKICGAMSIKATPLREN